MRTYVHVYSEKRKKNLKCTTGLYYGLKQYHKGDSFVLAAQ